MFRAYDYFKAAEQADENGLPVYRVTGISKLEELIRDVRQTKFPCLVVDYGTDGLIDLENRIRSLEYHTVHFLDSSAGNADKIYPILEAMFDRGKQTMLRMAAERWNSDSMTPGPCEGFNSCSVRYSAIGPVGMQAYGYTFNYEMNREHDI